MQRINSHHRLPSALLVLLLLVDGLWFFRCSKNASGYARNSTKFLRAKEEARWAQTRSALTVTT
jgi:hypothetical protein